MNDEYLFELRKRERKAFKYYIRKEKERLGHILKEESLVKGRMEGKRGRVKPRFMMLDDIKVDEIYEKIKYRIENVGET